MPIEQLIVLAIVQGITEFLPVSSSAHLILVPELTGWADQGPLIDVAVHVGSLLAVMLYFKSDTFRMFGGTIDLLTFKGGENRRLVLFLIAATLPALLIGGGIYMSGLIDHLRSAEVIGWATILFGLLLAWADRAGRRDRSFEGAGLKTFALVGLSQALAFIPGTSRSGITMTTGLMFGLKRKDAAHLAMLLSIPIILALGTLAGLELIQEGALASRGDAAIAAALSFASAFVTIWFFMKWLERMSLMPFILYRMALGIGLLVYVYFFGGGAAPV